MRPANCPFLQQQSRIIFPQWQERSFYASFAMRFGETDGFRAEDCLRIGMVPACSIEPPFSLVAFTYSKMES